MRLTCICCDFAQEFASEEDAIRAGWDTPERFTISPLCGLCPAAPVALKGLAAARARHAALHARWAVRGRPAEFELMDEYATDGVTYEDVQVVAQALERLVAAKMAWEHRRAHAPERVIDNASLPAGAPMYFRCPCCAGDIIVQEGFLTKPPLCYDCLDLRARGLIVETPTGWRWRQP